MTLSSEIIISAINDVAHHNVSHMHTQAWSSCCTLGGKSVVCQGSHEQPATRCVYQYIPSGPLPLIMHLDPQLPALQTRNQLMCASFVIVLPKSCTYKIICVQFCPTLSKNIDFQTTSFYTYPACCRRHLSSGHRRAGAKADPLLLR